MARGVNSDKVCERCGQAYSPTNPIQTWCTPCLTVNCLECGTPFHIGKKTRLGIAKFCSRKCQGVWRSKNMAGVNAPNYKTGHHVKATEAVCAQCHATFYITGQLAKMADNHFCTTACRAEWMKENRSGENNPRYNPGARVTVMCEWCGKGYAVWKTVQDKSRFCSKMCRNHWQRVRMSAESNPHWNGGGRREARREFMQTTAYKNWRHAVFSRDNWTCQACGDNKGHNLEAHHIWSATAWEAMVLDVANGVTLCERCHNRLHVIG